MHAEYYPEVLPQIWHPYQVVSSLEIGGAQLSISLANLTGSITQAPRTDQLFYIEDMQLRERF